MHVWFYKPRVNDRECGAEEKGAFPASTAASMSQSTPVIPATTEGATGPSVNDFLQGTMYANHLKFRGRAESNPRAFTRRTRCEQR